MWKKPVYCTLMLATTVTMASWAQPPEAGAFSLDEDTRFGRFREERIERMVEFLELSESQTSEWQALVESRTQSPSDHRAMAEQLESWRLEFDRLAEQEDPDLERLGQLALDIHQAHAARRASREQLIDELQAILTPEQLEKLEALRATRDFVEPRGRKGRQHHRRAPNTD
jgi:Spy/CpxP family protein refolding chaperone